MASNQAAAAAPALTASAIFSANAAVLQNSLIPSQLDCSKATNSVWLVKVPKYLAQKWNEAPDNSEVGQINITQTHIKGLPKPKQNVVFQLNESIGKKCTIKVGATKTIEEQIPLEHKFIMTPIENQNIYILTQSSSQQDADQQQSTTTTNSKVVESLAIVGKATQRAECTPEQNDSNYYNLKRNAMKKFIEPARQIRIADDNLQRTKFLPKPNYQNDKRDRTNKRLRETKQDVQEMLFKAFAKHQYYNIKDLEDITKQPINYLKDILHDICRFNQKGEHKNTWELKEEYKRMGSGAAAAAAAAAGAGAGAKAGDKNKPGANNQTENIDDDDDDDDDDDEDFENFEEDFDDDDDAMVGQM